MAIETLLPKKLSPKDSAYASIKELNEVLSSAEEKNIRNIALTGPYGSGKSSVIHTLIEDYKAFNYLSISLATLQADNEGKEECDISDKTEEEIQTLNRKIEYSILQQIIYKEKNEKVPNSRFRRIIHIDDERRCGLALRIVLFLLAFIVLVIPNFAFSILYRLHIFNDQLEKLFCLFSLGYVLWSLYEIIKYVVRVYANSKLNKFNLKDGEIEVGVDNSIFNKHLDEILYFFQVTNYNVVIIEDLDRFETENIFLKLRELNQLINESEIVGRHIVFLYAIKDDVFQDEARTKFFDYITTIIPVINPSNSKDKLKDALKHLGCEENEIPDEDLSEMAFFIQDMRILTNIANEYYQYRQKLYDPQKKNLNLTKLLGMIVYKNYYPRDFAQLHRRGGLVYKCISSKHLFIDEAIKILEKNKKDLEDTRKLLEANIHLKENDLRLLFLYEIEKQIKKPILLIQLKEKTYSLEQISQNEQLFEELRTQDKVYCKTFILSRQYYAGMYNEQILPFDVNFEAISKKLNFEERIALVKDGQNIIDKKVRSFQRDKNKIQSLPLNRLIQKYNIGETQIYKNLALSPLMDIFIRRGYIDEEYYDYISYFYPGMISQADRDLLVSMKQQIKQNYTYHIDKIDNFVTELKDYMFEHDAILNNELLDYFASKKNTKWQKQYTLMMMRLEREDAPLDFLSQYYQYGKQQKAVFSNFIAWNKELSWDIIENHPNYEEQELLREAWLRYCNEPIEKQIKWLNNNYSFISSRIEVVGFVQCNKLIPNCKFTSLNALSPKLLDMVVKYSCYEITSSNLIVLISHINKKDNNSDTLSLTKITETNNTDLIKYAKDNFTEIFSCLSTNNKEENVDGIIYILNSTAITQEQKIDYLTGQRCIEDFEQILEENWNIAIQSKVIAPTWQNIDTYVKIGGVTDNYLIKYIEYYHKELENTCHEQIENKDALFKLLLGTDRLTIDAFKSISKAYDNVFNGYVNLVKLDRERLTILLYDNKIVFSNENSDILQDSEIYAKYLIHHSKDFINNLSHDYHLDVNTALELILSDVFTLQNKCELIKIISDEVISKSVQLANTIIGIILASKNTILVQDKIKVLIQTATAENLKVYFAALLLSNSTSDKVELLALMLLVSLGGKYKDIAERKKRPILAKEEWNIELLKILESIEFISSTSEEKDGIRVYPKRV